MSEIIDIVDKDDVVIGQNTRHESYKNCTRNRIVFVVLTSQKGEIFLQRRSMSCSFMPGALDVTAGGHVGHGQTYREAARRELFEEVGVKCDISFVEKVSGDRFEMDKKYQKRPEHMRQEPHEFFRELYEGVYEGDFYFDDGEVSEVIACNKEELKIMIHKGEYMTPGCIDTLLRHYIDK